MGSATANPTYLHTFSHEISEADEPALHAAWLEVRRAPTLRRLTPSGVEGTVS